MTSDDVLELDILITPEQLEARWHISKAAQAVLRSRKLIPFVRVGPRSPRYRLSELRKWLARQSVE